MSDSQTAHTEQSHRDATRLQYGGRVRTIIFLTMNLAVFAVAVSFWHYLATGQWWDFSAQAYYRGLVTPLSDIFLHPLSILTHPWLTPVLGLLLGVIIFLPIMVASLYRPVAAVIFCLCAILLVVSVTHSLFFAVFLLAGCLLAIFTPLRRNIPFLAYILALVPMAAYLYLFAFAGGHSAEVLPLQRWVLTGPLLTAAVVTLLACGLTLLISKAARHIQGAIWPSAALATAGAIALFCAQVGLDELHFALITDGLFAGDVLFRPVRLDTWRQEHDAQGLTPQNLEVRLRDHLKRRQKELSDRCDEFLDRFEKSSRTAEVLWIKGQCRSLQLDSPAYQAGTVRFTAGFPLPGSAPIWRRIVDQAPRSRQAALAAWRLGELTLRSQNIEHGEQYLLDAAELLTRRLTRNPPPPEAIREAMVFRPTVPIPSRDYCAEALFRLRRLLWLIDRNQVATNKPAAEALAALLNENPYEADYTARLGKLVSLYERTPMGDNLKVAVAAETKDPYAQAEMLIWLAEDERTDAAVEANYQLGMLTRQTARARALSLMPNLKEPPSYFQTVIAAPPNPWQDLSRRHLAGLATNSENSP